jgi:hypothetical protein
MDWNKQLTICPAVLVEISEADSLEIKLHRPLSIV